MEPSEDNLDLPFPTSPIDTPLCRSVRHVKTKREGTCSTPPATYTTRSGRSVRPPDRFMVRLRALMSLVTLHEATVVSNLQVV